MRLVVALFSLGLFAACGADGPPTAPAAPATGISFNGSVQAGVAKDGG